MEDKTKGGEPVLLGLTQLGRLGNGGDCAKATGMGVTERCGSMAAVDVAASAVSGTDIFFTNKPQIALRAWLLYCDRPKSNYTLVESNATL